MEETKNAVSMQFLKGRLAMTVCHQDNREVTRNVLMLLSVGALAGDRQNHQQRVFCGRERWWQGETATNKESAKIARDTGHTKEARHRDADEEQRTGR